jgi:hypothetical protein
VPGKQMEEAFFVLSEPSYPAESYLSCLGILWAKHYFFLPFWHVLVPSKQLDAFLVLSLPGAVMSGLVRHTVGQTWLILAIQARDGAKQAAGNLLGDFFAQFSHVRVA